MSEPGETRGESNRSRRVVTSLLLWAAGLAMAVVVLLVFVLYKPVGEAFKILVSGTVGGLLALLLAFVVRNTFFKPAETYLSGESVALLAERVVSVVEDRLGSGQDLVCYPRWHDVPWAEVLRDAQNLEFFVSYMDTWVNQATDPLLELFKRGGAVRAYLPKPQTQAARRVRDRFPEYSADLVAHKIENTGRKLEALRVRSGNPAATVEVKYTDVFIMHCLMRIDEQWLLLSPFDHFRRMQIEGPAVLLRVKAYPYIGEWANKEFAGFADRSELAGVPA